jgi:hypothetical protein
MLWKMRSRRMPALLTTMSMRAEGIDRALDDAVGRGPGSRRCRSWPRPCRRLLADLVDHLLAGAASGPRPAALHADVVDHHLAPCAAAISAISRPMPRPAPVTGEAIAAIAMTEPGTGSDLAAIRTTAIRDGDHYVVNGQKTFITNGHNADVITVACKTDPGAGRQGRERCWWSRATCPASRAGATSRRSACTRRTPPSCSSTTCACRPANLLGDRGPGFRAPDAEAAAGAPAGRHRNARPRRGGAAVDGRITCRSARPSASAWPTSRTRASSWRRCAPRSTSPASSSTLRRGLNAGELDITAEEAAEAKWWLHRAAEAAWSTPACSSTAATATCWSTRSPGPMPTARITSASTPAPPRS